MSHSNWQIFATCLVANSHIHFTVFAVNLDIQIWEGDLHHCAACV